MRPWDVKVALPPGKVFVYSINFPYSSTFRLENYRHKSTSRNIELNLFRDQ